MISLINAGLETYNSSEVLEDVLLYKNYPDGHLVAATACCAVLMCIGIIGNLITVIALTQYKKVQNATASFIVNLHINDLIFCCTILPMVAVTYSQKHWIFGRTMCRLFPMIRLSLYMVGMFLVLSISVNRCIVICHPLWYPKIYSKKNVRLMLIAIWIIGCIMLLPTFFEVWGRFSLDSEVGLCTIVPDQWDNSPKHFLTLLFIIPSIVMPVCYIRIWWVARKTAKKSGSRPALSQANQETSIDLSSVQEDSDSPNLRRTYTKFRRTLQLSKPTMPTRKDKRLGTMIIIIMVTFYLFSLPYVIVKSVKELKDDPAFNIVGYILFFAMTSVNPIIYVVLSKEYRQAYMKLMKRVQRKWSYKK